MEQCHQRFIMIDGKRIIAGLDVGEILLRKDRHIRVEAFAVWDRQIGMGTRLRTFDRTRNGRKSVLYPKITAMIP